MRRKIEGYQNPTSLPPLFYACFMQNMQKHKDVMKEKFVIMKITI
jgi:hypothetical protein